MFNTFVKTRCFILTLGILCVYLTGGELRASAEHNCVCGWLSPGENNGQDVVHCFGVDIEISTFSGAESDCDVHCHKNFGPPNIVAPHEYHFWHEYGSPLEQCKTWAATAHPGKTISEKKFFNE